MWKSESNIWVWALFSHHRFQGLIWGHQTCIKCFYLLTYITSPKELCPLFCAMARKEVLARRHKEKRVWEKSSSGLERCQASTLSPSLPWHPEHKYTAGGQSSRSPTSPAKEGISEFLGDPFPPQPLTSSMTWTRQISALKNSFVLEFMRAIQSESGYKTADRARCDCVHHLASLWQNTRHKQHKRGGLILASGSRSARPAA